MPAPKLASFHLSAELAHRVILERLLIELHKYGDFRLNEFNSEDKSLVDYAARFWDGHLKSSPRCTPEDLQERIDHILFHRQCFSDWMRYRENFFSDFRRWNQPFECLPSPLLVASRIGLIHTARGLLEMREKSYRDTARDLHTYGKCPFICAAREGHLSLLDVLLEASMKTYHLASMMEVIDDSKVGETSLKMIFAKLQKLVELECLNADGTGQINDNVARFCAANEKCGSTLVRLLFLNDRSRLKFSLDSVFYGAADSPHPEEILRMVLEKLYGAVGPLNDGVGLLAAATNDPELARLWFRIIIRPGFWEDLHLQRLAQNLNLELMEVFLEIYGQRIVITDGVLIAAVSNQRDCRIIDFFPQRQGP